MTATYTNRKGKTYYLHQGKTKFGNPKYFFTLRDEGNLVEAIWWRPSHLDMKSTKIPMARFSSAELFWFRASETYLG